MFTFFVDVHDAVRGSAPTAFMAFFVYAWIVWSAKALAARRYRPFTNASAPLRTSVLVPVYQEPAAVLRTVLASVRANDPTELIAVIDGGDEELAMLAEDYCDRVLRIPKAGKREAIATGLAAADPSTEIIAVVDSDTIWEPTTLVELLRPFADERVGGVTPRQAIFDVGNDPVRRLADWIEDLRYHLTVPAQSIFGQVGCLAGRTIAYRRAALEPAVEQLVHQQVFGVPQEIGDDRVLTGDLLRRGWRTVYQSTALVHTDAPTSWRSFWGQQLRWGRSSQRETVLSIGWMWRRPVAFACFVTDIVTPFALYGVLALAVAKGLSGENGLTGRPLALELPCGYFGMVASIGLRQIGHFRRVPRDLRRLPIFALQLTFVLVPIRLAAFATMLHQSWVTRPARFPAEVLHEAAHPQSAHP